MGDLIIWAMINIISKQYTFSLTKQNICCETSKFSDRAFIHKYIMFVLAYPSLGPAICGLATDI